MTRFRAGSASDVGQMRSDNQDSKLVADDVSVFAVADGMGGHQGGEVASAIAIATLEDVITSPTAESLVEAVKEANRRIYAHASQAPELRGMGTTLVAIALVDQGADTEEITWVNVGDSRVYVLRDGQLVQLSQDHSLVEDLRRGGQLSAEEAAVHPQRNILTRALGIDAEVEVDWRGVEPFLGDRFLLCSDGLFNEVDSEAIVDVLSVIEDPGEAATELVRRANASGGRDNITCVVVDVIDDDGRAAQATAAGGAGTGALATAAGADGLTDQATPPATVEMPAVVLDEADEAALVDENATPPAGSPLPPPPAAVGDVPTDEPGAAIRAGSSAYPVDEGPVSDEDLPFGRTTTDVYGDMEKVGGRHRAVTALVVLAVLVVVVGGALFGIRYLDSDGYFVEADGERVVIYQGKPGGGLLFGPSEKGEAQTAVDDLTVEDRAELDRTPEFDSLADARSRVNIWDARAQQAESEAEEESPSTTTSSTSTTTSTTTTTRPTTQGTTGGTSPADEGTG